MPPLDNLKVIDLTRVLAGPFCAMLLGDMGADVIKIEEPAAGDDARGWAPFVGDWSAYFLGVNRSKRSLALDLKQPGAPDVLRRLLAGADVFIENFKPGSLDKLGFGYEQTRALNPRLVHCSISGYGKNWPAPPPVGIRPDRAGGIGLHGHHGHADGPPVRTGIAMTDYLAGLYAFSGILLALRDRDRTGRGQHVDIALFDSVLSTLSMPAGILQATGRNPRRMGNDHAAIAPYETLRAKDGTVMIAAANPRLWKQLCAAVGVAAPGRRSAIQDEHRSREEPRRAQSRSSNAPSHPTPSSSSRGSWKRRRSPADRSAPCREAVDDPQVAAASDVLRLRRPRAGRLQGPRQSDQAVGPHGPADAASAEAGRTHPRDSSGAWVQRRRRLSVSPSPL